MFAPLVSSAAAGVSAHAQHTAAAVAGSITFAVVVALFVALYMLRRVARAEAAERVLAERFEELS